MSILKKLALTTASAALCCTALPAFASSHREAPNIAKTPKVDNTDLYMFRSYEPGRESTITVIANFYPEQNPSSGPNYFVMDPDALYEFHIDNDGDAVENLTYQFKFSNALINGTGITLNVGGKDVPIALRAIGPITNPEDANQNEREGYTITQITGDRRSGTRATINAPQGGLIFAKPIDYVGTKTNPNYAAYANRFIYTVTIPGCATTGRVFVGQRGEAFAINLTEVFDLVNFVPIEGDSAPFANDGRGFPGGIRQNRNNDDLVGRKNVTSIAMELPIACVTGAGNGVIGAWSTVSLPQARLLDPTPSYPAPTIQGGSYVQVSRLGMPLVNEVIIGLGSKDLFNAAKPMGDAALADFVTNPTFPAILSTLFRAPVNATLGTNFASLAPSNFPRNDLVAAFLTGIRTVNQLSRVTPSEMLRLNTAIAPTPQARQSTFGVVGDDLAGFPNGRRPGDDAADIILRVAMGRLCYPVPVNGAPVDLGLCTPAQAPTGNVAYTDGAPISARDLQGTFPYLNTPTTGSPKSALVAAAAVPARP